MYKNIDFQNLDSTELYTTNGGAIPVVIKVVVDVVSLIAAGNCVYNFAEGVKDGYQESNEKNFAKMPRPI